ncbi:HNH endonuclease signature motif containing protein [Pseudoduganella sp. UC29_106]|uniref:HNH endonuclease signature motif containing protein n=1 Tax=Pseudoduganella sp. UC29_106 TaxID=3374553 RepID=UPI0037582CBB
MKLQTLKPRLSTLRVNRIAPLASSPDATPRLRGRAGVERRAKWLAKYPLCVACEEQGRTTMANVVDHKIPLWKGGRDDESNFQSLCQTPCHDEKTAREAAERAGKVAKW